MHALAQRIQRCEWGGDEKISFEKSSILCAYKQADSCGRNCHAHLLQLSAHVGLQRIVFVCNGASACGNPLRPKIGKSIYSNQYKREPSLTSTYEEACTVRTEYTYWGLAYSTRTEYTYWGRHRRTVP